PDPVTLGDNLAYNLFATNNGPSTASNVVITDILPSSVTFVSASPGCSQLASTITCPIGALANGATVGVEITVKPSVVGLITNTATVRADQTDPNSANNTATATTKVIPA